MARVRAALAARKAGADERSSFIVERSFNWQTISQFSQSMSLFASKRILEIHIPSGKPGVDGGKALIQTFRIRHRRRNDEWCTRLINKNRVNGKLAIAR